MVTSRMMMIGLFCIGLAATLSCAARAGVIFQYTGNTFTFTDPTLGGPFVGSNISGFVELSTAVGGATYTSFDSFSLTAGPTTITDATPGIILNASNFVTLSPDASTIALWGIFVITPLDPLITFIETKFDGNVPPSSTATIDLVGGATGTLAKAGPNDAGVWTRVPVVPLPAALPLMGTGLAVLGFMGWRRKRKPYAA